MKTVKILTFMKKLFLVIILSFFSLFLFSQENTSDSTLIKPSTTIIKDSRIDKLNETYTSSHKLKGFRVQIHSGQKKQLANQARLRFTRVYRKTKAHDTYEQPNFKVRVGDFKTKLEALKFKNELTKHFPNCYIVKDEIDISELNK